MPDRQWTILDGKLSDAIVQFIRNKKGKYRLILEKYKITRTLRQNSYYWAYLTIIGKKTGDDPNSLHELFKRAFLPPRFIKALGKEIKIPASTTELDKNEFGEYIERISIECGVPAPDPEELKL